jgi:hypothetical protein
MAARGQESKPALRRDLPLGIATTLRQRNDVGLAPTGELFSGTEIAHEPKGAHGAREPTDSPARRRTATAHRPRR